MKMATNAELKAQLQSVWNNAQTAIGNYNNGMPLPDNFWSELANKLPEGYSFVLTASLETGIGVGLGSEIVVGTLFQWDGTEEKVFGLSGTYGEGSLPVAVGLEFHLLKGGADDLAGWSLQLETALLAGFGITLSIHQFPLDTENPYVIQGFHLYFKADLNRERDIGTGERHRPGTAAAFAAPTQDAA
jgi:hypothetical protein